jgi:tagatose 6-phosphate kinase
MIVTVTMNPAIDIGYSVETFELDKATRVTNVSKTAGGKGLNVARVLHEFSEPVLATGIVGGKTGEMIELGLDKQGIAHDFLETDKESRNCIAILDAAGNQTELLEQGPTFDEADAENFLEKFNELLKEADVLTISGSAPAGMPDDFYAQLVEKACTHQVLVVLDASGATLRNSLLNKWKPTVIKPNHHELAELLDLAETKNIETLKNYLANPIFQGISLVVVTLGADGAFVKSGERYFKVTNPKINAVNPVGSGDSTVAGLASGLLHKGNAEDIIKKAMTLGLLNALEKQTGHINTDLYDEYYRQIEVQYFGCESDWD